MKRFTLLSALLLLTIAGHLLKAQTGGSMTFTATTLDNGGTFSPRHVLAIWIEDDAGNFVKTLEVRAERRIQYLYTWNASSGGNTTDAVTGATLTAHRTENVDWDCTDTQGAVVSNGNYKVFIEYTSAHEQGPLASFTFNKADDQVSLQPGDETYFTNIGLTYTPEATGIDNTFRQVESSLNIYPNPFSDRLSVDFNTDNAQEIRISLYNNRMQLVDVIYDGRVGAGHHSYTWNEGSSTLPPAGYYVVIENGRSIVARNIVKVK